MSKLMLYGINFDIPLRKTIFMKKILFILFIFISLNAQKQLPNVDVDGLDGVSYNLKTDFSQEDKIYVFAFWATWCAPCIQELDAIHAKYKTWQNELDFELIAVSIDDSRTQRRVKPFLNGKKWNYKVLLDSNQDIKRKLSIVNVPYTIVVKNNKIEYISNGYAQGGEDELFEKIKSL